MIELSKDDLYLICRALQKQIDAGGNDQLLTDSEELLAKLTKEFLQAKEK